MYHALSELHVYTGNCNISAAARPAAVSNTNNVNANAPPPPSMNGTQNKKLSKDNNDNSARSVNADEAVRIARNVFNDNGDSGVNVNAQKHGTNHNNGVENVFSSAQSKSKTSQQSSKNATGTKNKNIGNLFSKMKFPGAESLPSSTKTGSASASAAEAAAGEWCDEHFTQGCMCKIRGNQQKTPTRQEAAKPVPRSNHHSKEYQVQTQQKPSFQRPANPKSNILASGWVEMIQKRVIMMRSSWKDVLISLVDGKKTEQGLSPATFWVQKSGA